MSDPEDPDHDHDQDQGQRQDQDQAGSGEAGPGEAGPGEAGPGDAASDQGEGDPGSRAGRRRRHSERVRRRRRIVAVVLGLFVVVFLAVTFWYELDSHALGPAGKTEVVQISKGEGVDSVAAQLSDKQVISSTLAFELYGLVHGSPTITPGSYAFRQNQTFAEVHAILEGGPNVYVLTVSPGLTLNEIAGEVDDLPGHQGTSFATVADSGVVHSVFSPPGSNNLEGMLGTGTYLVLPGETDTALLTDMVDRFDHQAQGVGLSTASAAALGVTPYQVIIAASVVEKEGYYAKNMPDVARVIYNRLANNMPLQMNSTVLYALGQDGGPVTPQDLQLQNPYNTYLNKGLPPTPICSPSPIALAAAVHPPPGSWLYFVLVDKNGTLAFSDTFAEQLANEKLAQSRGVG